MMRADNCCSWGSNGRHGQRHRRARSPVDAAMAVAAGVAVEAVAVGEVGVTVSHDPLCAKGGKTVAVLMGRRRNVASVVASLGISLENADPRKSQPKQIWPRSRNLR
jgi:hypothetical protein